MSYEKSAQLTEREINHRLKKEIVNAPIFLSSMVGTSLGLVAAVLFTTSNLFLPVVIVAGVCASTMLGYITLKTTVGKHKSMLKIIEKVKVETEEERKIIQEQVQSGLIAREEANNILKANEFLYPYIEKNLRVLLKKYPQKFQNKQSKFLDLQDLVLKN